jgi:arginyl-tRNA synthetase
MAIFSFRRYAAEAVSAAIGVKPDELTVTTPPDPSLGDYAVGLFPVAKALKTAPPVLAFKAVQSIKHDMITSATANGPYANLKEHRAPLLRELLTAALSPGADLYAKPGAGKTVCIDFSSPNIAKLLAYHHIRSTVIGHALVNIHRALGWRTIGINHLGDWGTSFGMLLAATRMWGVPEPMTVEALNAMYKRFRDEAKTNPSLEDEARAWFKKLEDGDAESRALWQRMRDVSLAEFQEIYDLLGVTFDVVKGESEYEHLMPGVIELLEAKGLVTESQDARVVDLSELKIPPLLLRKKDGATLYATRDLASAIYRHDTWGFDRSLYVVAREQGLHFQQMIAVLKKAGLPWADDVQHVSFGLVRIGGRKSGTRTGNVVLLKEVLAEAQEGILARLRETSPELPAAEAQDVARLVGIGAVVFANLSSQRDKDVDFRIEDIISPEGDSGAYVQYGHARIRSILRRGGITDTSALVDADPELLRLDEEWALAKVLSEVSDETARAARLCEPYVISRHLLDVCAAFSRWYTLGNQDPQLKVLAPDPQVTRARLALAAATANVLRAGLGLLGITAPETM